MKKSRTLRITLGTVGPLILGSLCMCILEFISAFEQNKTDVTAISNYIKMFVFFFIFSIPFMGIQAIIYALTMEFYISKTNNFYLYVSASTVLGFTAGLSIMLGTNLYIPMLIIGILTGLILGLILYFMHERYI